MSDLKTISKKALLSLAVQTLEAELEHLTRMAEETRKAATHEEAKPENDKDTRGLEQSYLARGQAMRAEDLAEAIQRLRFMDVRDFREDEAAGLGALVTVESDTGNLRHLLLATDGGTELEVGEARVMLIHTGTPMGRALLGKRANDDFVLRIGGAVREFEVLAVR